MPLFTLKSCSKTCFPTTRSLVGVTTTIFHNIPDTGYWLAIIRVEVAILPLTRGVHLSAPCFGLHL
nr:MAG TPA: hypothetical protein [Caudoviricetes sp.]